jgi:fucose permease
MLRVAGGEQNYAFYSTAAQLVFGLASFLSPGLYAWLVSTRLAPAAVPWIVLYWVFAGVAGGMMLLCGIVRLPVARAEETAGLRESWSLLRDRTVLAYFVSIFAYVGSEQGVANWISQFLSTYHGVNPRAGGAQAVAGFWGLMTAGCVAGLALLKIFDSRRVLVFSGLGALASLTVALFGPAAWSRLAFPAIGLFASVMWPVIFSLGLNSVKAAHGAVAGMLCTAIVGGAVLPPVIGQIGDYFGLRAGMLVLYLTLGWVTAVGLWARPIVGNLAAGGQNE